MATNAGKMNPRVFPEPVLAIPIISIFSIAIGIPKNQLARTEGGKMNFSYRLPGLGLAF